MKITNSKGLAREVKKRGDPSIIGGSGSLLGNQTCELATCGRWRGVHRKGKGIKDRRTPSGHTYTRRGMADSDPLLDLNLKPVCPQNHTMSDTQ